VLGADAQMDLALTHIGHQLGRNQPISWHQESG
jgi:hypothetical protein